MQSFAITCEISVLWLMFGYSLAFGTGNDFIGGSEKFWFQGDTKSGMCSARSTRLPLYETSSISFVLCSLVSVALCSSAHGSGQGVYRSIRSHLNLYTAPACLRTLSTIADTHTG